jgi:hypothetical protein
MRAKCVAGKGKAKTATNHPPQRFASVRPGLIGGTSTYGRRRHFDELRARSFRSLP